MAMNKKMTMAEREIRDFAQRRIDRTGLSFTEDMREQVLNYASMTGDEYLIRKLVRSLEEAVRSSDAEKVQELLDDARVEIQSFPDSTIGMAEMRGYGYTNDDMYPLRRQEALELHRVGEKIFCLQPDGSSGEYASREMIMEHDGIYGIEKTAWQRMMEQDEEMDEFDNLFPPMAVIGKDEALKMYDAGETVYLITTYSYPIAARERMEIERGADHYQMERDVLERMKALEAKMQEYPQITSLKEAKLLLGNQNMYGIYQIADDTPGRNYKFMNLSFIERHTYQIHKDDYKMVYSGRLWLGDTLDSLYEKFNIAHPEDYTGHSLSVSDIVVLNENGTVKAYFVDSISFRELPDFLDLEPELGMDEIAYRIGDRYFAIQVATEGYDYSFYDKEMKLMDGGVYNDPDISIREAIDILLKEEGLDGVERMPVDYEELREKAEQVEQEILRVAREQMKVGGEYKPLAKVEELEEANYNMIDNVINNTPPKKDLI